MGFDCSYDIEICEETESRYSCTSTQKNRDPSSGFFASDEFDLQLDKKGKLVGNFENKNTVGTAEIAFHQRKRWSLI